MNIHYYQLTAPPSCDGDLLRVENGHSELFRPGAVQEWFPVSFGPDPKAQEITKDEASWLMRWTRRRIQQKIAVPVLILLHCSLLPGRLLPLGISGRPVASFTVSIVIHFIQKAY